MPSVYRAQEVIRWARCPIGFAGEGETRKASEDETPKVKSMRDDIFRTIERLQKESDLFSGIMAKKYRAMAYFGKDAARPFDDLKAINDRVVRAALLMMPRVGTDEPVPPRLRDEWETDLGWRDDPTADDIAKEVEAVIASVEKFYGGWLKRAD